MIWTKVSCECFFSCFSLLRGQATSDGEHNKHLWWCSMNATVQDQVARKDLLRIWNSNGSPLQIGHEWAGAKPVAPTVNTCEYMWISYDQGKKCGNTWKHNSDKGLMGLLPVCNPQDDSRCWMQIWCKMMQICLVWLPSKNLSSFSAVQNSANNWKRTPANFDRSHHFPCASAISIDQCPSPACLVLSWSFKDYSIDYRHTIDKRMTSVCLSFFCCAILRGQDANKRNFSGFNENLVTSYQVWTKKQGKDLCFQGQDFLLVLCPPGRRVASVTHIAWSHDDRSYLKEF